MQIQLKLPNSAKEGRYQKTVAGAKP